MTRYARSPNVVARRIAGELVLVPVAARSEDPGRRVADFFVLNDSGEFLWEQLTSPRDASELAQLLITRYETTIERARADVELFLDEMRANRAIVPHETG